jgi:hypothetical protein
LSRGGGEQGGEVNRPGHVVKYKAEMRMGEEMLEILPTAGNKIVEADDIVSLCQEAVAKVGT